MANINAKGRDVLYNQFKNKGKGFSRDELKMLSNGRYAHYTTIQSQSSLMKHQNEWSQFAKWMQKEHPGVKGLKKVTSEHVKSFLRQEQARGLAEKTLKARVTAINHVMVGSVWNANQAISLKNLREKGEISAQKGARNVYKPLTSQEFREKHADAYEKSRDLIDFTRGFGLRKSEILGKHGTRTYAGITTRNLWKAADGSERLFTEVIGKGGKYRLAPVSEALRERLWAIYGHMAREYDADYFQKSESERQKMLLAQNTNQKTRLFQSDQRQSLHIHRADYVQTQLAERQAYWETRAGKMTERTFEDRQTGYSRIRFRYNEQTRRTDLFKISYKGKEKIIQSVKPFSTVQIGTWKGYAIAACDVMRFVGHNRLDVLQKYL